MHWNESARVVLKAPLLIVIATILGALAAESAANAVCVPNATTGCRWKRWENSFQITSGGYTKRQMYQMEIAVNYLGDTQSFSGIAFWDGGSGTAQSPAIFKFRTAFPDVGKWDWSTACVAGACVGNQNFTRSGSVNVGAYSNPDNHVLYGPTKGFLEVPVDPYWNPPPYQWEVPNHVGGDRFFWLGDTAWAAPMKATYQQLSDPNGSNDYLPNRKAKTFSVVHYAMPSAWMGEFNSGGKRPFCAAWRCPVLC